MHSVQIIKYLSMLLMEFQNICHFQVLFMPTSWNQLNDLDFGSLGFSLRNRIFRFECLGMGRRIWISGFVWVCGLGIGSLSLALRSLISGFGSQDLNFWDWVLEYGSRCLDVWAWVSGFECLGLGLRIWIYEFRYQDFISGFEFQGFGLWIWIL